MKLDLFVVRDRSNLLALLVDLLGLKPFDPVCGAELPDLQSGSATTGTRDRLPVENYLDRSIFFRPHLFVAHRCVSFDLLRPLVVSRLASALSTGVS
jgi:hypothetical protein